MHKVISFKETCKVDHIVTSKNSVTQENTENLLNKFCIFDADGELCRDGHNIVLNIGRLISSARILGRSVVVPAVSNTSGVEKTITISDTCVLKGFAIGNGAAIPANNLSPREPLPADVSMSNESGTTGWLPFSNEVTLPTVSTDGKPYVLDTKIKLHIDGINPVMKLDETGFYYAEHTMKINENEAVGTYFNEIGLFFEVTQGATKFYVPYSKFVFAGLPNLGGKNSYTILYGTYL